MSPTSSPTRGVTRSVSGSVVVEAPPAAVFELLVTPARHREFDGSGMVGQPLAGPQRLDPGDRFGMAMRYRPPLRFPYRIVNVVVEYVEDRRVAWRHFSRHVWRYELEPLDAGSRTRVTETFDWSRAISPRALELLGYPTANGRAIEASLRRLRDRFAADQQVSQNRLDAFEET